MLSSKSPPSITSKPRSSVHPHSHLRPLNRLLKKVNQLIHNTLRRIDRGNHERIWIHRAQVKIVPKAANPLCKKDPLCSAVAFPEWMQHIDRVVKVRYLFRQLTMGQSPLLKSAKRLKHASAHGSISTAETKAVPFLEMLIVRICPAQS